MSNLIKYNSFVVKDKGNVVIDSNQRIMERLKKLQEDVKSDSDNRIPDADGFISGLNASVVEELVNEEIVPEEPEVTPDDILADARAQAEEIIANAMQEAERIRLEAKENGYQDGSAAGRSEYERKNAQLEKQYAEKQAALQNEYDERMAKMEPELVDVLLNVFSRVTHTMAEDKKDMILCLINSVMRNTDLSKEFFIRVSPEDYKFALNNQNRIYSAVAKDVHIEIAEDTSLSRNQCIIETDAGVFDCSLDIQLDNLIKDIRLLSCMND